MRLPWQTDTADSLLVKENTWVPVLAPRLPLPVPVPQRLGQPTDRYPHPWIVATWVPGTPADLARITDGGPSAATLANFMAALHQPASAAAPAGRQGRGGTLMQFVDSIERHLESLTGLVDAVDQAISARIASDTSEQFWDDAVSAPLWDGAPIWLHADLQRGARLSRQCDDV